MRAPVDVECDRVAINFKIFNAVFIFRRFRKRSLTMGLFELMLLYGSGDPSKCSMENSHTNRGGRNGLA